MPEKNNEFVIRMQGVNLSKEASQRIQRGINELSLQEFAGGNGNATDNGDNYCGVLIPHKWIGRQVLVANIGRIQEIAKQEGQLAFIAPAGKLGAK